MDFSSYFNYPTQNQGREAASSFLSRYTEEDWKVFLSYTQTQRVNQGEVVVRSGDQDTALFIVVEGELNVLLTGRDGKTLQKIAVNTEGSVFGELSFLDGQPRSATVQAQVNSELLVLTRSSFDAMAAKEQRLTTLFLMDLSVVLAQRLRNASRMLAGM